MHSQYKTRNTRSKNLLDKLVHNAKTMKNKTKKNTKTILYFYIYINVYEYIYKTENYKHIHTYIRIICEYVKCYIPYYIYYTDSQCLYICICVYVSIYTTHICHQFQFQL